MHANAGCRRNSCERLAPELLLRTRTGSRVRGCRPGPASSCGRRAARRRARRARPRCRAAGADPRLLTHPVPGPGRGSGRRVARHDEREGPGEIEEALFGLERRLVLGAREVPVQEVVGGAEPQGRHRDDARRRLGARAVDAGDVVLHVLPEGAHVPARELDVVPVVGPELVEVDRVALAAGTTPASRRRAGPRRRRRVRSSRRAPRAGTTARRHRSVVRRSRRGRRRRTRPGG